MGCDIHTVVQVKKNDEWITLTDNIPTGRSYNTFAVLANVRNGVGFAGIKTGNGFVPIAEPRGYPEGFKITGSDTHQYKEYVDPYPEDREEDEDIGEWMGDHSHSFLTLAELEVYWEGFRDNKTMSAGVFDQEQYEEYVKTGELPTSYSGVVCGMNVVTYDASEYKFRKKTDQLDKDKDIHVKVEWAVSYNESTGITDYINNLRKIAEQHKVESPDLRLVFGFDS